MRAARRDLELARAQAPTPEKQPGQPDTKPGQPDTKPGQSAQPGAPAAPSSPEKAQKTAAKQLATQQKLPETGSDASGAIGAATILMLAGGAVVLGRSRARHAMK